MERIIGMTGASPIFEHIDYGVMTESVAVANIATSTGRRDGFIEARTVVANIICHRGAFNDSDDLTINDLWAGASYWRPSDMPAYWRRCSETELIEAHKAYLRRWRFRYYRYARGALALDMDALRYEHKEFVHQASFESFRAERGRYCAVRNMRHISKQNIDEVAALLRL